MSEEVNNPTAGVEESAGTDVETTETSVNRRAGQGRDRIGEALDIAKNGAIDYKGEVSIDNLTEVTTLDDGGHKGIDYNRVIGSLPDEAKNLLSNMRADYTRKTQELANQRNELSALQQSLIKGAEASDMDEVANRETVQLDPYDTQSFEAKIQQEVAKRLQEMMAPMREEQVRMTRRAQLDKFKTDNPDLMDYKADVAKLLQTNQNISLEDAYNIVKGRTLTEKNKQLQKELDTRTSRMRDVGLKLSQGSNARDLQQVPKHLKKGHEIYAWLKGQKGE